MTTLANLDSVLMIADIARTTDDFRPLDETLDHICLRVSGLHGYDATALFLPDREGETLAIMGSWGLHADYIRYVNRDHPPRLEPTRDVGLSPSADAFRTGHVVAIADVEEEPRFEPWREIARAQGYHSLICVPVILRSRVIGVLNCYGRTPHRYEADEIDLLQLVARLAGVAIETARIAAAQRGTAAELRDRGERLQRQNADLARLAEAQARLTEHLVYSDVAAVESTARTLADITGRAVLVAGAAGSPIASAGPPGDRDRMASVAARRDLRQLLRRQQLVTLDGASCLRLGPPETPIGVIVVRPRLEDERDTAALAAIHAAAVITAELETERADRALETHARPATLLALAHGLYDGSQLREVAGVIGVPADSRLRLAILRCRAPEATLRLCRRPDGLRGAGWPVIVASAAGQDALTLLPNTAADGLRRAAARAREAHPEIQRIGISSAVEGLGSLPAARREAEVAATADAAGVGILFEDLGVLGMLAGDLPPGRPEQLVRQTLGPLLDHDSARGTHLVETIRAYIRHSGRVHEAAAVMGIHPNTFHQRLRRGAQLGGFDLHDFRRLGSLVLALEWHQLMQARSG